MQSKLSPNLTGGSKSGNRGGDQPPTVPGERSYKPWRFENENNETTREVNRTVMKWYKNDCHDKPMWCGQKNYKSKVDFSKSMVEKRNGTPSNSKGDGNHVSGSDDFKIALAAMVSEEYFETLTGQFLEN